MKEELIAVRKLIEKPENWTQGTYARNKDGETVSTYSSDAVCFCLSGAITRACFCNRLLVRETIAKEAAKFTTDPDISPVPQFNDTHSHAKVLALLDRLIS